MSYHKARVVHETDKALLLHHEDADGPQWVPKSAIVDITEEFSLGEVIDVEVTPGFAEKLGWE